MSKKKNAEKPTTGAAAKTNKTPEKPEKAAASTEPAAEAAEEADATTTPEAAVVDAASSAEDKIREFEEKYLRAEAEIQNIRRRAEKQITEAHQLALKSFVPALGEVYDCLEKSLEAEDGGEKTREGVALTLRKLKNVMDMHHISPIRPDIGAQFDPTMHMAIGMLPPTDAAPDGTVAVVVQPGYMISGRVVRAADVMVSQAPPDEADKTK